MQRVIGRIINVDLSPEFGEVTGTEAPITVEYRHPVWTNAPMQRQVISVTKDEAVRATVGDCMPCVHKD